MLSKISPGAHFFNLPAMGVYDREEVYNILKRGSILERRSILERGYGNLNKVRISLKIEVSGMSLKRLTTRDGI